MKKEPTTPELETKLDFQSMNKLESISIVTK